MIEGSQLTARMCGRRVMERPAGMPLVRATGQGSSLDLVDGDAAVGRKQPRVAWSAAVSGFTG
jgi:hypothetical protein